MCHEGQTSDYETAALPAELRRRGAGKDCIPGQREQAHG